MAHLTAADAKQVSDLLIAEAGMPANLSLYFQEYMTTRMKGGRKEFLIGGKFGEHTKLHVVNGKVWLSPGDISARPLLLDRLNEILSGISVLN